VDFHDTVPGLVAAFDKRGLDNAASVRRTVHLDRRSLRQIRGTRRRVVKQRGCRNVHGLAEHDEFDHFVAVSQHNLGRARNRALDGVVDRHRRGNGVRVVVVDGARNDHGLADIIVRQVMRLSVIANFGAFGVVRYTVDDDGADTLDRADSDGNTGARNSARGGGRRWSCSWRRCSAAATTAATPGGAEYQY
jgi:hypothetical protein